ncbi:MAG: TauD/TfdA family dioxygenase [Rhodospirillaceae bacterium]
MALTLRPITESLGVEVTGIDLAQPISAEDKARLNAALNDKLVVVVRDQDLTPAQYLDAMSAFGDLMDQHLTKLLMPEHPHIAVLDSRKSAIGDDGKAIPIGSRDWHTDHTNHARPPKVTALYAVQLPSLGGDTGFANMQAAYASLPEDERRELDAMTTVNVIESYTDYVADDVRSELQADPQRHPFIRTHPDTGRKAIYVHPGKLAHFDGMDHDASKVFVNDLLDRVLTPDVTYRHQWRQGDLVFWDNRATLHVAYRDYDHTQGRVMHRVILEGEVPF